MYKHIKKEHIFIFLVLFTTLVLFTYFDKDFNYTTLSVKELSCIDEEYQCCYPNQGEGINYFSLDNTCSNNKQCWTSCTENVKETNIITSSAVINDVWSPIKNFFIKLFSRETVGFLGSIEQCRGKNNLFTASGEQGGNHASKFIPGESNAYNTVVCADNFQIALDSDSNKYSLIKLSEQSGTNSHVEKPGETGNYPTTIYIKPKQGLQGQVSCLYQSENPNPSEDYECLFSIDSLTNAHVGACTGNEFQVYSTKIYCKITTQGQPNPPGSICERMGGRCSSSDSGCSENENQVNYQCAAGLLENEFVCCIQGQPGNTLTIISNPIEGGTVTKTPQKESYDLNEPITLTASQSPGYTFSSWANTEGITLNNAQLTQNPLTITMPQNNVRVTVIFRQSQCTPGQRTCVNNNNYKICNGQRQYENPQQCPTNTPLCDNGNCVANIEVPSLIQSDYEVFWANDGIVAFSFDKYIQKLRTQNKLNSIKEFKVYRSESTFTSVSGNPIATLPYALETGQPRLGLDHSDYFDFWDGENQAPHNLAGLSSGTYYYAVVPIKIDSTPASTIVAPVQVSVEQTQTVTVSGLCNNNVNYASCSEQKPSYCGIGDNLISNNGLDLDFISWDKYNNVYEIIQSQNHKNENSKVMHINIAQPIPQALYGLSQTINIKPNTYYRLSAYVKAQGIVDNNKPFLYVSCSNDSLSDNRERKFLASNPTPRDSGNINNADWTNYNYIFKTYKGAEKCNIYPVYFKQGSKGEIWIDGLRLEELSSTTNTPSISNDCGICGCPINTPYCQANGQCNAVNLCGNGILDAEELCDYNRQTPANPLFGGKTCVTETSNARPNGNLICTQTCTIDSSQCILQPAQPENCQDRTADADNDGIRAVFDSDCSSIFDNRISMQEVIPSSDEVYTMTNIQISCNYAVKSSTGIEKNLLEETYIKDCIKSYLSPITDSKIQCENKITKANDNSVLFRKCNVGENQNEETPVICEVDEKCSFYPGEKIKEEFISITEYPYCSEISEGAVELNNIRLSSANEPGEELRISGKLRANEPGKITIKAALIDLESGQIKKESSVEIDYESESLQQKSFEINFIIPELTTKDYFVFVKAYMTGEEPGTCIQSVNKLKITGDINDEGPDFETNCSNLIDDDSDSLADCEDNDCSTDRACIQQTCTEGQQIPCTTNFPGICSIGKKTCINRVLGECISLIQPGQRPEVLGNSQDDNCNNQIDEGSPAKNFGDSDNDNLPDEWEIENFNTITLFNGNDDPDKDGITNIEELENDTDPKVSDKESLLWLWIILAVIIIGALIFAVLKFLNKPRTGSSSSNADPRLKDYVRSSLAKGFTKSQIKQALISKGWSEREIEKVLR